MVYNWRQRLVVRNAHKANIYLQLCLAAMYL